MNQLPDWMYHAIEESSTCKFASTTVRDFPVALPVFLNYFDPDTGTLIISSPVATKRVKNVHQQHMFRLPRPGANRREKDCHPGTLAHILNAFHRDGRRDNQCTCIGIKVIEKDRQGHRNITGRCAGKLTGKRLFNCMVHPIGQLVHLLPTFLFRESFFPSSLPAAPAGWQGRHSPSPFHG